MQEPGVFPTGESIMKEIYKSINNTLVLDIGANEGMMADRYLSYNAKHIICFEPNNILCEKIKNNLINKFKYDKEKFTVINCGLSDKNYTLNNITFVNCWTLGLPNSTGLAVSPGAQEIVGKELFNVELRTLDSFLDNGIFGDNEIKFIKIDVDGYEAKVLRGAKKFFEKYKPIVFFELSYLPKNCGDDINKMLDFIYDELRYKMVRIDGFNMTKQFVIDNFPWHTSCDILLMP
jgi:FkbM family methyltransferase